MKGSHCSTNDEGLGQSSTSLENDQPMLEKKEFISFGDDKNFEKNNDTFQIILTIDDDCQFLR